MKFKLIVVAAMLMAATICFAAKQGSEDIISVTQHNIKNDGTPIGAALNELIKRSYGKTVYFPAGCYNLTEPIILPLDYVKNVNLLLDKSAVVKSDSHLEALLKVGYSEMKITDRSHRRFSYIEGGVFDCENADNGILLNGLKQMVQLRNLSVVKGHKTHIRIEVTDENGTSSSDTKIDNVTIHGFSSAEESYGIYINKKCCDCKISNTFIYATKYGILTKSAGHIINNVHILSMYTTGGKTNGAEGVFAGTQGIRFETGGFFLLNEVYFDTVDKSVVIAGSYNPAIVMDKCIYYSYRDNFGTAFIYKEKRNDTKKFQAKISNPVIEARNPGYKIFDLSPRIILQDTERNLTFVNATIRRARNLSPICPSLMMRMRGQTHDVLRNKPAEYDEKWYTLGAIAPGYSSNRLLITFNSDTAYGLNVNFDGKSLDYNYKKQSRKAANIHFKLIEKEGYCIVLFKPSKKAVFYPEITDLTGSGNFMGTPDKGKSYTPADYGIPNC